MRIPSFFSSRGSSRSWTIGALLVGAQLGGAITLNVDDADSIKAAARTAAQGMVNYYQGNQTGQTVGILPAPYYWWEAGAAWGGLIDYWYFTGDTTYNELVTNALLAQVGPNNDFMPPNQTKTEGNDDQAFWGLAVMAAAEKNFPNPPTDKPQWLALAQAVFNSQAIRWDADHCNGGLRWQIFTFNNGYNYKNTISNGCFFQLAARLARYTGNQTYADWAEKMYDWVAASGLMSTDYKFYDGTDVLLNCSQVNHIQWTYNAGTFLLGSAMMYNYTNGSAVWQSRVQGILTAASVFFAQGSNIMYEVACEPNGKCDVDQRSFKAYLSRWMAATTQMASFTTDTIMNYLKVSAQGAASSCTGGTDTVTCGLKWTTGNWDGSFGVGEQMSAMEVFQNLLISKVAPPVTAARGGSSKGDPNAGTGGDNPSAVTGVPKVTAGDKAGAGILTALVMVAVVGGAWWMVA